MRRSRILLGIGAGVGLLVAATLLLPITTNGQNCGSAVFPRDIPATEVVTVDGKIRVDITGAQCEDRRRTHWIAAGGFGFAALVFLGGFAAGIGAERADSDVGPRG